ncbi:hypothetical protein MKW94_018583 [Papaver nudicaule]|uniref:F-box domain-containing protein n=1 Tax=Papaver nudicaule TaxID=74823 RepID=A0AA41V2E7_PAPNU|nr:hypothetical protein [Papaver nudicaule]
MESCRNLTTNNAVGLCLLPSELIQDILFRLALPEIIRMKTVSKTLASVITSTDFRRDYNIQSETDTWVFVYTKRSLRDSILHGFTDRSDSWFKIRVSELLSPVVPPGEDLSFLTASGDFFLFSSNNCRQLIAVNLKLKTVKKIPPSPLGPRGISSWRRSGLKLIAGPHGTDRFRFLFADLYENRPVLFEYVSESDTWRSIEAVENELNQPGRERDQKKVYLSVIHRRSESVVLAVGQGVNDHPPVILRPRFDGRGVEERLAVGFSTSDTNTLNIFGDDYMAIVRSANVDGQVKVFGCIEVWRLSGGVWELVSKVPQDLVNKVRKPYSVIMGCLEARDGIVRVILVSNFKGMWDTIWFSFDLVKGEWKWVPIPETRMEGLNIAGITLSTGLKL